MTDISKAAVDVAANVLRVTGEHYIASLLDALRAALDEAEARAVKAEAERDELYEGLTEATAAVYQAVQAALDADSARMKAEARAERLEAALQWCSGSADFNEGGVAREGWLKLCDPLLKGTDHE